jgi:hypothetical protein
MIEFHNTGYGRRFFEAQLPALIRALEKIGTELEKQNKANEAAPLKEEDGPER